MRAKLMVFSFLIFCFAAKAQTAPPQGFFSVEHAELAGKLASGTEVSFVGNLTFFGNYDVFSGWSATPVAGVQYEREQKMIQFLFGATIVPANLFSASEIAPGFALRGQYKSRYLWFWTSFEYSLPNNFYSITRLYGLVGPLGVGIDGDMFLNPTAALFGGGPSVVFNAGDKMSLGMSWRRVTYAPGFIPQMTFSYPRLYGVIVF